MPSIEKDKQNAVLPDHPEILMKTADPLPLIVGLNDKEGRLALLGELFFTSKFQVQKQLFISIIFFLKFLFTAVMQTEYNNGQNGNDYQSRVLKQEYRKWGRGENPRI